MIDVLKDAQQKGYAEADPTADIEGHDACQKDRDSDISGMRTAG